jgi:tubulin-specific chaperone D
MSDAFRSFVNLLVIPQLRNSSLHLIREYLAHPFPKVRYETAEYFYLQIVGADYGVDDTSDIEAILLETRW